MKETALTEWHREHGARMIDFHGWRMPVQYSSITEEHRAVRSAAGLFDLGHMGRIRIEGSKRLGFVDRMTTVDLATCDLGDVKYGFVCNEEGGILDDITVYKEKDYVLLVVNASNRAKILEWLQAHRSGDGVAIRDVTESLGMIAIQGPRSRAILQKVTGADLEPIRYYHAEVTSVSGAISLVSRTGYTGENGYEIYLGDAYCLRTWEALMREGRAGGLVPAGLGARDTLRLEAAMPLYGNELSEAVTPFEAGLGKFINLDKGEFIGRQALVESSRQHHPRRLCCIVMQDRSVPRTGYDVFYGDMRVGVVTSGTFSPTLGQGIAMAYVDRVYAQEGTDLQVAVRGRKFAARVVKRPFYKRKRRDAGQKT